MDESGDDHFNVLQSYLHIHKSLLKFHSKKLTNYDILIEKFLLYIVLFIVQIYSKSLVLKNRTIILLLLHDL